MHKLQLSLNHSGHTLRPVWDFLLKQIQGESNGINHRLLRNFSCTNQLSTGFTVGNGLNSVHWLWIYSEWSAHLAWWHNLCACPFSEGCPNLAFGLSTDLCMCLAHDLAGRAWVTQGDTEDLGDYGVSPGSPYGGVVTCGDTPLHINYREVLMQDIIWLYNPDLATEGKVNFYIHKIYNLTFFKEEMKRPVEINPHIFIFNSSTDWKYCHALHLTLQWTKIQLKQTNPRMHHHDLFLVVLSHIPSSLFRMWLRFSLILSTQVSLL